MAALPLITLTFAAIPPAALAAMPPSLDGTAWVLDGNDAVSLQFEQGRVNGSDGCIRFHGPYISRGTSLTIGPAAGGHPNGLPADAARCRWKCARHQRNQTNSRWNGSNDYLLRQHRGKVHFIKNIN